ncbi:hypothetical protein VE01_03725 [Pseudogymnoascus verrucosus]|uniref:Uncharacterized protein n=1 Tax=Pseudogymnoascus verrucosus TaxID=342668 RepID=A0A1B8GQG8_9PEZI|nr:uncharacterized protein VE01_03725 [Pseudogymnoascus verrucosus]OBT98064.1 hypothetical protein VE01_03725 [Pseudogymnoascus verrucosus]
MESRRVIADSDDDCSSISAESSPQKDRPVAPVAIPNGTITEATPPSVLEPALRLGTGSTDSVLFERIRSDYCGALDITSTNESAPQLSPRPPGLDERIINQRMSSSISQESVKKLKRSNTMHGSSFTSISEPTTSNKKAKRSKSMKAWEGTTQVTSPDQSKELRHENRGGEERERDEWDFPGSSAPGTSAAILRNTRLEKTMAERTDELELLGSIPSARPSEINDMGTESGGSGLITYGKSRRTKTMGDQVPSSSPYVEPRRRTKDDSETVIENKKRKTRQGVEGELFPMLPKPKRNKRAQPANDESLYNASVAVVEEPQLPRLSALPTSLSQYVSNEVGISEGSTEQVSIVKATNFDKVGSDLMAHKTPTETVPNSPRDTSQDVFIIPDNNPGHESSELPSFDRGLTTMVMANMLTSSQNKEYMHYGAASSDNNHIYSLPDMMEPARALKLTDASSTVPNDTPRPDRSAVSSAIDSTGVTFPLSSSPVVNSGRKVKRSKTGLSSSASKPNQQKLSRHKSMGYSDREVSVDELALSQPRHQISPIRAAHTVSIESLNDQEIKTVDITTSVNPPSKQKANDADLQSSQDFGQVTEMYQPRLSARRSKTLSAKADIIANEEFAKGLPMKRKRRKITKTKEIVDEPSADEIGPSDESAQTQAEEAERPEKRSKAAHALPDTPKSAAESPDEVIEVEKVVSHKRRGRHSKTPVEKSAPIIEDSDMDDDEIEATQKPVGKTAQKAQSKSKEIEATQKPAGKKAQKSKSKSTEIAGSDEEEDEDSGDADTDHAPSRNRPTKPTILAPPQSTPPPKPTKEMQTPSKPCTPHSPLQSGKVPYRVGLSKRNRIAPLLKIIRK